MKQIILKSTVGLAVFFGAIIPLAIASERQYVTYSEFGAVGDGVTDDFDAIIATHKAANELGLPVKADADATYYIGDSSQTAIIQTDTDWAGAKFIIDDSKVDANRQVNVFTVTPTLPSVPSTTRPNLLEPNQPNLGMILPHDSFVIVTNSGERTFGNYPLILQRNEFLLPCMVKIL